MKRKIDPRDNASNIVNTNHGTSGTNLQYDQNQGNRGTQLNPNKQPQKSHDSSELSDSELLRKLQKKYFGIPPAPPPVVASSSQTDRR